MFPVSEDASALKTGGQRRQLLKLSSDDLLLLPAMSPLEEVVCQQPVSMELY